MSDPRLISFGCLCQRLGEVLGQDSPLYRRFDQALRTHDPDLLSAAMGCLALYPECQRVGVQDALLVWLFDVADNSGLTDLRPATRAMQ